MSTKYSRTGLESSSINIIPLQYLHKCILSKSILLQIWFLQKINDHLAAWIFRHGVTKTKNLPVALCIYFFGISLMWSVSPLGVLFHSKSSVCSFTLCVIFGPLIFFRYSVTKTQILIIVSLCIFHDANQYKNNQNDQKQVNWSHLKVNFI